jgi:hypothetical protein
MKMTLRPVARSGRWSSPRAWLWPTCWRPVRARHVVKRPLAFFTVNRFCVAPLYGHAGRLTAKKRWFLARAVGKEFLRKQADGEIDPDAASVMAVGPKGD